MCANKSSTSDNLTGMKKVAASDIASLHATIRKLFDANKQLQAFRVDLWTVSLTANTKNLPRYKVLAEVVKLLLLPAFCKKYGAWVVAEVEDNRVQFSSRTEVEATLPVGWVTKAGKVAAPKTEPVAAAPETEPVAAAPETVQVPVDVEQVSDPKPE